MFVDKVFGFSNISTGIVKNYKVINNDMWKARDFAISDC